MGVKTSFRGDTGRGAAEFGTSGHRSCACAPPTCACREEYRPSHTTNTPRSNDNVAIRLHRLKFLQRLRRRRPNALHTPGLKAFRFGWDGRSTDTAGSAFDPAWV